MKRDILCVSEIIQKLEKTQFNGTHTVDKFTVKGHSEAKVNYHIQLLKDAGYVKTEINQKGIEVPLRLTWQGHEYLYETLNETVKVVEKGIDMAEGLM